LLVQVVGNPRVVDHDQRRPACFGEPEADETAAEENPAEP
jgi:hypothetical protein